MTEQLTKKILVLGVDGMDPRLTKHYLDQGRLPNVAKYLERGAAREDLVLLGGVPTITPPMWTTLATGSYPNTHGITCFWRQDHEKLDSFCYNLDSRLCQSEQLWNVFVKDGFNTLVWHWPGSAWPPTMDSPKLSVVDGMQPGVISYGCALVDSEKMIYADTKIKEVIYKPMAANDTGAGCVISDLPAVDDSMMQNIENITSGKKLVTNIILSEADTESAFDRAPYDIVNAPLTSADGWTNAPQGAKVFVVLLSHGLVRRYGMMLKDDSGKYTKVQIYKNKKDTVPLLEMTTEQDDLVYVHDEFLDDEGKKFTVNIGFRLLKMDEAGENVLIWVTPAIDIHNKDVWHPQSLHDKVFDHIGSLPATGNGKGIDADLTMKLSVGTWEHYCRWQSGALRYLIAEEGFDVVFSHLHNIDAMAHTFWGFAKKRQALGNDDKAFQDIMLEVYEQTDRYLGDFLPLLDEGWTIFIVSDHGLLCSEEDEIPFMGDAFGCNFRVLEELGYANIKKDENGKELKEIDWATTKALAPRGNHIWINLKGRDTHGIVEPEDKYELEAQLITDLYNYKDPHTGKRVIALAVRNKEAALFGMSGPECGDIIYFLEEGYNRVHGDSLPTTCGYAETSVSPIFIAAGTGIKPSFVTNRVIRQVDVAPTIAVVAGVNMPADCEGAPVYQILEKTM